MIFETKPTVVGHRGFGAGTPGGYQENTLASYLAAVENGLTWIELNVQRWPPPSVPPPPPQPPPQLMIINAFRTPQSFCVSVL